MLGKNETVYPVIMAGATYVALHHVFSVGKTSAIVAAAIIGIATFATIRALEHPPGG